MSIGSLFHRDPTRRLEEVQKVNASERAESDVEEFYETESARDVLTELGSVIETPSGMDERFLYLYATFGSGKTHLLKLIGFVADSESEFTYLGDRLAKHWDGFDALATSIRDSHVDHLKPVFLNLLDRDASKEPPLPFFVFEAIARELDYPTDPNWLLEWAWTVDTEYDGVWDHLTTAEHNGQSFEEVIEERAPLRRWLYEVLPAMDETTGTVFDSRVGVKESIERAENNVEPTEFEPADLVERVETATAALNEAGPETELLLGLDEVALFVGDSPRRYREFEETMEALQSGPNPVVVATGQFSLPKTRKRLIGEPDEGKKHWTRKQKRLVGADTEIIVRKRWLQKDGSDRVRSLLSDMSDLSLVSETPIERADRDRVESYPFREYDLTLLRTVMQELITQGRSTDREYIQGRALLVLVRSLFTRFGWADKEEGALVTWDELFDLLVEETTYVPLWVQELLENTLIPTIGGDEEALEVRVAKALYLVNRIPHVPAIPENLGRLMLADVDASVEDAVEEIGTALENLEDSRMVLTETTDSEYEEYKLVSEEQESVLSRAQATRIAPHRIGAWLETQFRENDDFLRSDGSRHEVDVGDERLVPLRYEYSILDPVKRAPTTKYDAIRVRVLAASSDAIDEQVPIWQDMNDGREGGEHILITIDVSPRINQKIDKVLSLAEVLGEESESHEQLEQENREDKRDLESTVAELLEDASVYTPHGKEGSRPAVLEQVLKDQLQTVFGSTRKVLSRPLVQVEDAKRLSRFFQGNGEWPLHESDGAMLGVDTETGAITDTGWCREFIDRYESRSVMEVETLLQQTWTSNGAYRGTPRESIEALLLTLATSNEDIALKVGADYVTEPRSIGRKVRTKNGLLSLRVQFDAETTNPKVIRAVVSALLGREPTGDDPEEWVDELESWVAENSVSLKRRFRAIPKEFDMSVDRLEEAVSPAYGGGELSMSALGEDGVHTQAEAFADVRELLVADEGELSLWEQFTDTMELMETLYPSATITSRMRATADESGTVPTVETVNARIEDATEHRIGVLSKQYRRITDETTDATDPDGICSDLTDWVRENESVLTDLLERATETFEGCSFDRLESVIEPAWNGDRIDERAIVDSTVRREAERYAKARELLSGDLSPWSELEAAGERLRSEHPDSPTTESVLRVLGSSRLPSLNRVRGLIDAANDPKSPGTDDDVWADLQRVAEELRQELPNTGVTDEVIRLVEAEERPSEEQATELLNEAEELLGRIRTVSEQLDRAEDGTIVVVERDGS